jgi:hypothetical protein
MPGADAKVLWAALLYVADGRINAFDVLVDSADNVVVGGQYRTSNASPFIIGNDLTLTATTTFYEVGPGICLFSPP